jgi:hypothetical protein
MENTPCASELTAFELPLSLMMALGIASPFSSWTEPVINLVCADAFDELINKT